jgi:hypothetical protein
MRCDFSKGKLYSDSSTWLWRARESGELLELQARLYESINAISLALEAAIAIELEAAIAIELCLCLFWLNVVSAGALGLQRDLARRPPTRGREQRAR